MKAGCWPACFSCSRGLAEGMGDVVNTWRLLCSSFLGWYSPIRTQVITKRSYIVVYRYTCWAGGRTAGAM